MLLPLAFGAQGVAIEAANIVTVLDSVRLSRRHVGGARRPRSGSLATLAAIRRASPPWISLESAPQLAH